MGWPEDCQRFFIGLELDNSKAYFERNRDLYRRAVREPMDALLESLSPELGAGRVFRINRDIRFSSDKSPYKTNIAASFESGAYISLSARDIYVAAGLYRPEPEALGRFRQAVAGPVGEELAEIVGALDEAGYRIGGLELKRVPRGFPADHEREVLLRHKGITGSRHFGLQPWLGTPSAREHILAAWGGLEPLAGWVQANVLRS